MTPRLVVVVDTEEEFDWKAPHSRLNRSVTSVRALPLAHKIFDQYTLRPTYVVDFPVADQAEGYLPLRELYQSGRCEIGAHLHPWVTPPFDEVLCNRNTFPGNLPEELERQKLDVLCSVIESNLGVRPVIYRAGRYGVGAATATILKELRFEIDTSVVPQTDFTEMEGPNFSTSRAGPYWFGERHELLELPLTVGFCGALRGAHGRIYDRVTTQVGRRIHAPGFLARSGLLERVRLTPEGTKFSELRRLTETLLQSGHKVFVFSYHSPSLSPGNTPYVRNQSDLSDFVKIFERYFDYFMGEVAGLPSTLSEIRKIALGTRNIKAERPDR